MSEDEIRRLTDRALHVAKTFDPSTRLPLVVLDSTALPLPQSPIYTEVVNSIISRLPSCQYALLFFACGAPNKPSWSWVAQTYAMLDRDTKKRLRKLYIVHESWWVRAVIEMLRGVVSSKFKSKIIHVSSLSQLASMLDITLINIHPNVYLHNRKVEDVITIPRHHDPIFGVSISCVDGHAQLPKLWHDAIAYLKVTAPVTRGVFRRTQNAELLYILRDCYDRSQFLDLDNYGCLMTASVLKLYLYELPSPILHIQHLKLPVEDTPSYCIEVLKSLPAISQKIITDLFSILHVVSKNTERTQQTPSSLGACVGPSLLGLSTVSKEGIAIGTRVVRNLITFWPTIMEHTEEKLVDPFSDPTSLAPLSVNTSSSHIRHNSVAMGAVPRRGLSNGSDVTVPKSHSFYNMSRNNSSPELRTRPEDDLPPSPLTTPLAGAFPALVPQLAGRASVSNLHQAGIVSDMPPPPPPKPKAIKTKLSSNNVLQPISPRNEKVPDHEIPGKLFRSKTFDSSEENTENVQKELHGTKFVRSKTFAPLRRGKMVAELAKLYEEKSHSAQILVDIDRNKRTL